MSQATGIQWTDNSSNPLRYCDAAGNDVWACVKHSTGCANCYSETLALRFNKGKAFTAANMRELTPYIREKELKELLSVKKTQPGCKVFLCDMTDLFGEWVPDEFIDKVMAVIAMRTDVTFQVLTKRAERMAKYFDPRWMSNGGWTRSMMVGGQCCEMKGETYANWNHYVHVSRNWPLPNLWVGVSVENQEQANERIPHLLKVPAKVRFLSLEPLLGPVILHKYFAQCECGHGHGFTACPNTGGVAKTCHLCDCKQLRPKLGWGVVGGESGRGARGCDVAWIRSLVEQCKAASVACFVKQLGSNPGELWAGAEILPGCGYEPPEFVPLELKSKKGDDMVEWNDCIRVREFPAVAP